MTRFDLVVAVLLAALPLQAKPRQARPGADELLLKMLSGPTTSYAGVERVQVFLAGAKPKALKVLVSSRAGMIRRETLPPKKKAAPLVQVHVREDAVPAHARLRGLYAVTVSTGGVVAKRRTWKLELRLRSGILRRALWVDRDSGLLMKRETYRDDGTLRRRERIVKLSLPAPVEPLKAAVETGPWAPDGFVFAGESGGARCWSNGLESYEVRLIGGKAVVTGDLAEDDASRVAETAGR
ncbi:MAG: hypothetical protein HYV14_07030 [Elusimicrobia bacterium]|nr:hypothetical protein [Elusimicrobiota bacterium]